MNKRHLQSGNGAFCVGIEELQALLCVGRTTALKIGIESGAAFRYGKRMLYNVRKIESYMEKIAEENAVSV